MAENNIPLAKDAAVSGRKQNPSHKALRRDVAEPSLTSPSKAHHFP